MRRTRARSPQGILGTRHGLAASVSLLLILFSLTIVSTIAYSYALGAIGSRKQDLKLVAAEEKMLDIESAISAVVWSPTQGASSTSFPTLLWATTGDGSGETTER